MSFFAELRRRNVVRVGIAYVAAGWALAQVAEFAVDNFDAPLWALQIFVVFLILGLPVALVLAWAYELTPDGIKRDKDVDRSRINARSGRKLDFIIIGVLAFAVGFLLIDKFVLTTAPGQAEAARQSIAVLPLDNLSDDNDNFSDGLTEEIVNVLAKNRELRVAGRTSSFSFKGMTANAAEIGESLNVDHYLEGSVRRAGSALRINVQLIKVEDGLSVWSDSYDRELMDIFDVQDDIAGEISRALHLRLAPPADRPTDNIEAYIKFIEAKGLLARSPTPIQPIDALISEALAFDSGFASALELRAIVYWIVSSLPWDAETARQAVNEVASAAVELDPSLAAARYLQVASSQGLTRVSQFNALESALAESPAHFNLNRFYCFELRATGYLREAVACGRRLVELEPLAPVAHWVLGMGLSTQGRYAEARDSYARAVELGGRDNEFDIGFSYLVEGQYERAMESFEQVEDYLGWRLEEIPMVVESALDPIHGDAFLDQWVADNLEKATDPTEYYWQYTWYLVFGRLDPYFEAIEEGLVDANGGWSSAEDLENQGAQFPSTGYFRHPGYLRTGNYRGLTDLWDARGKPDMCDKVAGEWVCQ